MSGRGLSERRYVYWAGMIIFRRVTGLITHYIVTQVTYSPARHYGIVVT